jgi:hypothetical protein
MRWKNTESQVFAAAAFLTIVSAILYCSWPLGFWLNPEAMRGGLASELGALGQPYNWVFIWGDIVSGVLLVMGVFVLIRRYKLTGWPRRALIFLAIYGICGAFDAALPMSCLPSEQACGSVFNSPMLILHGVFDISGSITLIMTLVAATIFVHSSRREWLVWVYAIGIGGTIFALLSGVLYVMNVPGYWAQRYYITLSCVWVASIPFVFRPKAALPPVDYAVTNKMTPVSEPAMAAVSVKTLH